MKASESVWFNQKQKDSVSYKKFLPGKMNNIASYMEMIGVLGTIP